MSDTKKDELAPCPFCGGKPEFWIVCYDCGFTYGTEDTRKSIIQFWNNRRQGGSNERETK